MTRIITSLVHEMHDKSSTGHAREAFFARCHADRIDFVAVPDCVGLWFDDSGHCYQDPCTLVYLSGSLAAIKAAVAQFGEAAQQQEMLFVEEKPNGSHIVATGLSRYDAEMLAKTYGGATYTPQGAVSLDYNALVAGVDYGAGDLTYLAK